MPPAAAAVAAAADDADDDDDDDDDDDVDVGLFYRFFGADFGIKSVTSETEKLLGSSSIKGIVSQFLPSNLAMGILHLCQLM